MKTNIEIKHALNALAARTKTGIASQADTLIIKDYFTEERPDVYRENAQLYTDLFELAVSGIINEKATGNFSKTVKRDKYSSWSLFDLFSTFDIDFLHAFVYDDLADRIADNKPISKYEAFIVFYNAKLMYPQIDAEWNNAKELWNNENVLAAIKTIEEERAEENNAVAREELITALGDHVKTGANLVVKKTQK